MLKNDCRKHPNSQWDSEQCLFNIIKSMPLVETKNKPLIDHLSDYESSMSHHTYYSEVITDCHILATFKENNKKEERNCLSTLGSF